MSVRRVCIHTDRDGDPVTVDVGLPSGAPVGELLPAIVDMVDGRSAPDTAALHWRLDRMSGGILDEALSLTDNDIHDGELLTLSRGHGPALGPLAMEPGHVAVVAPMSGGNLAQSLPGAFCVSATALTSVALAASAGSAYAVTNVVVAGAGACAAAAMTVATGYGTASSMAFVSLASATGFLAVPSGPAAPNVLLAAAAAVSASLLMLRLSGKASAALSATAVFSLLSALVTLVAMPVAAVGAVLSSASLVLLALAPRFSVLAAGLGSDQWHVPDHGNGDVADRTGAAHATLSGLVVGGAAGSASGAVIVAVGGAGDHAVLAFTGVLTLVLLLRARSYVDPVRRIALGAAGFISGVTCLGVALNTHREYVGVTGGVLIAIALVVVRRPRTGAFWSRLVDQFEYAALAAVVPAAGWVSGVYDLVGGFHLR
jgi:type VII secretion integral membrane protein EccD